MSCCDGSPIVVKNTISGVPIVVSVQSIDLSEGTLKTSNDKSGTDVQPGAVLPLGQNTTWYAFSSDGSRGAAGATITLQIQWLGKYETVQLMYDLTPANRSGDPPCSASYSLDAHSSGNCFATIGQWPDYQGNPDSAPVMTYVLEWYSTTGCTQPPGPQVSSWTASAPQGGIWQPGNTVTYGVEWLTEQGAYVYGAGNGDAPAWGPTYTITDGAYPALTGIPTDPTNGGYQRWLVRRAANYSVQWIHNFGTDNTTTTYTDTSN